jgi:hypothetical protein
MRVKKEVRRPACVPKASDPRSTDLLSVRCALAVSPALCRGRLLVHSQDLRPQKQPVFRSVLSEQHKKERILIMSAKTKKALIAVAILLVLVVGAVLIFNHFKPAAVAGGKEISVQVVHGDGSKKDFDIRTDAENLRGALEQESLIAGSESDYGLYVVTVDGETADEAQQQWWCFTKGGEMLMTGVDDTMIADGDAYEITLTTGW